MNCIYTKIREQILQYFRKKKCRNERSIKIVDTFTTIIDFVDEQVMITTELIQRFTLEDTPTIWTLRLHIGENGQTLLKHQFGGDEFSIIKIASNLRYSLESLMEGYTDELRKNTQVKYLI